MRDSDMERSNVHLPADEKEAVRERPDMSIAEACRRGLAIAAKGEEVAETEAINERVFEVLALVEAEYEEIESDLSIAAPELAERLQETRISVIHEATKDCYERKKSAELEVDARESDTTTASPGYELSPAEAAESLIDDRGMLSPKFFEDGTENLAIRHHAEKCGMNPDDFFEYLAEELHTVPINTVTPSGPSTVGEWMDQHATRLGYGFWDDSQAVTDGGE